MSAIIAINRNRFLPLLLVFVGCHRTPTVAPESPSVCILTYHTFDSAKKTPYTVSSRKFTEQMRYLAVQKIPVISMAQLTDHLTRGTTLPAQSVVITIDDGYDTARTVAWPILKKFNYPFTVYVYPRVISRLPGSLTWEGVRQLSRAGVDIQSHSLSHPLLTHPDRAMNKTEYEAWIDKELRVSKSILEEKLRRPVNSLAYPYGGYDEQIVDRTKQAGYLTALTCDDGNVNRRTPPLLLNRRLIFRTTTPKQFAGYVRDQVLEVGDLQPRDGERTVGVPSPLRGRILNMDRVQPGTFRVIIDKLGSTFYDVQVDTRTGQFAFPMPPTPRRGYFFVSLSAKDAVLPKTHRTATWIFIAKKNKSKK